MSTTRSTDTCLIDSPLNKTNLAFAQSFLHATIAQVASQFSCLPQAALSFCLLRTVFVKPTASKRSKVALNANRKACRHNHRPRRLPAAKTSAKMKSIAFLLALLLVALLSVSVQGLDQSVIPPTDMRGACLAKSDGKNVVEAIDKFCKNTKIV